MATSTFGKQFIVKQEKADDFVEEMTRTVAPTLKSDFKTGLLYGKDIKDILLKALN